MHGGYGMALVNTSKKEELMNGGTRAECGANFHPVHHKLLIENGDRKSSPNQKVKNGAEFLEIVQEYEDFKRVIDKLYSGLPLKKKYEVLPIIALLLTDQPLTKEEVKSRISDLIIDFQLPYHEGTIRNSLSIFSRKEMSNFIREINELGIKRYELIPKVKNYLIRLLMNKSNEQQPSDGNLLTLAEEFFKRVVNEDGHKGYVEQLKENIVIKGKKELIINYEDLVSYAPELAEKLIDTPENILSVLKEGLKVVFDEELPGVKFPEVEVRVRNLIKTLKPAEIDFKKFNEKFIQVKGIVGMISQPEPFITKAKFVCRKCGYEMIVPQKYHYDYLLKPEECLACSSKDIMLDKAESDYENFQILRVQDPPDELKPGESPKFLEVILTGDLIDSTTPGDQILVTGVLKMIQRKNERDQKQKPVLIANYIESFRKNIEEIELSKEDVERIVKEAEREDFVERLIDSIAPELVGEQMKMVKKGILLSLLGSSPLRIKGKVKRSNIHILIIGDPGLGKSELLNRIAEIAPRAVVASAEGVSKAGFTAAVVYDELARRWVVEAGVMVLADGGYALLDELEKMNDEDRSVIHRAMEQGVVEIHKAGVNTTLRANATVIAVANPQYGVWNFNKPLIEQIPLPPTLLDRFDLIFPLITITEVKEREKLLKEIYGSMIGQNNQESNYYDAEFIRKFIVYARKTVNPILSEETFKKLLEYDKTLFKRLKKVSGSLKLPISFRQFESLIRLSLAHARLNLRKKTTEEDAKAAIELYEWCFRRLVPEEELDVLVITQGKSTEMLALENKVMELVKLLDSGEGVREDEVVEEIVRETSEFSKREIKDVFDRLHSEGKLSFLGFRGGVRWWKARE